MKSYNEAKKLKKEELLEEYKQLAEDYEELKLEKDRLDEWAGEQENAAYELSKQLEETKKPNNKNNDLSIVSVNKFIRDLKSENLYSKELEEFIEAYLRYSNI